MASVEDFYQRLGVRVANLRKQRGLTQESLGELLEPRLTRAAISNVETGKQRVLAHTLVQLAARLEVSVEELVGDGLASKDRSAALSARLAASLGPKVARRLVAKMR